MTSNDVPQGAVMAYEDLKADSVVDVKPYTPANWHPDAGFSRFGTAIDTSGFQLYIVPGDTCLIYQHVPGATVYPVTCRLAPQTNLTWRDYTFSGTIVKPKGATYDSVEVGLPFYWTSPTKMHNLLFKRAGVYIAGGKYGPGQFLNSMQLHAGDSVRFTISVESAPVNGVPDSAIHMHADVIVNGGSSVPVIEDRDTSVSRIPQGFPGVQVDFSRVSGYQNRLLEGVRFQTLAVRKID